MQPNGFPEIVELGVARAQDAPALVAAAREDLLGRCDEAGAVVIRGLCATSADDFDAVVAALDLPAFSYAESLSNAVRIDRTPRVFTANEAPAEVEIPLHHELAQTPRHPSRLLLFCETAPERGGETPLCRSDQLLERLAAAEPRFVSDCERLGLRYTTVMPSEADLLSGLGRSWRDTLGVTSRPAAESRLAELGYDFAWQPDGSCRATTPVLSAIRRGPSGRRTFFNQLIAAARGWKDARNEPSRAVTFGDATPLDEAAVEAAVAIADELAILRPWRAGDVVLIDNFLVMHGRRPYAGERQVLASLAA